MKIKLILLFTLLAIAFGGVAGGYLAISRDMPSIDELKHFSPESGTRIYADDDVMIGELKSVKGIFVPIDQIPNSLVNAVIAVEDSRFWKHKGIDYIAIGRAVVKDLIHVSLKEGGSTITQQLAKVVFLTPEKTIKRKLMEASLAVRMEKSLTKKEILELYLNRIYFGHGAYGVEMAARTYFGKSIRQINQAEASLIAGLIKAPSTYSPFNDLARAKDRQLTVLGRMEEEGYIKPAEKDNLYRQPLYLASLRKGLEVNHYFTEYVRKYLEEKYGADAIYKGGLKVYTTLNRNMQSSAVSAVQLGLREIDKRRGWRGPLERKEKIDIDKELKSRELSAAVTVNPGDIYSGLVVSVAEKEAIIKTRGITGTLSLRDAAWAGRMLNKDGSPRTLKTITLPQILKPGDIVKVSIKSIQNKKVSLVLEQEPEVEGALVALEPHTGFIRAMVGGYDFTRSDFNRSVLAKRQPGSAFKPIIYAAAMDHGFTPASTIVDEPVTYTWGQNEEWNPENYDKKYYGPTRLREALTYSRNVVTVRLAEAIGIDNLMAFARTVGFHGDMPRNLSIALGSFSITPLDLAAVYSVFAADGTKTKPVFIKYVLDRKGRVIESNSPEPEQVISPQTSFLITSMMEDVVQYGTGWRAKALGRPVAGKTGTSSDYKDAWFVGYTPSLVSCVWVGFDNFKPLGSQETGGKAAAPIWTAFMQNALTETPEDFTKPHDVVSFMIDSKTGLLSRGDVGIREFFKEGTQPRQYAPSVSARDIKDLSQINFD